MKFELTTRQLVKLEELYRFISQRSKLYFEAYDNHVDYFRVSLGKTTEPREGKIYHCKVRIGYLGAQSVSVENLDADPWVAINRAVERACWTASRRLQRQFRHDAKQMRSKLRPAMLLSAESAA